MVGLDSAEKLVSFLQQMLLEGVITLFSLKLIFFKGFD